MRRKLNHLDEEAIREFEQEAMRTELNKLRRIHEQYMKENPHVRIICWDVYMEHHGEKVREDIRKKYNLQYV